MVSLMGGVLQRSQDVFALQEWIIRQDFLIRGSRAKQFQHVGNTYAQTANAGPTATLAGFNGDAIQPFEIDGIPYSSGNTQSAVHSQALEMTNPRMRFEVRTGTVAH